jgi:excisionase family DNA binding protein
VKRVLSPRRETRTDREDAALRTLLTVDEMADLLRTTSPAIYAQTARGQLPGVTRLGRRLLFRRQLVLDWLDRQTAPSPKEWR